MRILRRTGYYFLLTFFFINHVQAQETVDHWEMAVKAEQTWKYHVGTSDPGSNWTAVDFDDASWNEGPGGFGYGDSDDGTTIPTTPSVFMRIKFTLQDLIQIEKAILLADYDDAFVAYINGIEVGRSGISGTPPAYQQYAEAQHEAALYQGAYPDEKIITKSQFNEVFVEGENTLAIQVHNIDATSSDLSSNFYLALGLNITDALYQPVTSWFREPLEFNSSNLPIIKINTNGQNIPDEPKITATMGVIDNGPGNTNYVDDPFNDYNGNIGIEIRGSSSQMFPKKQYAVELWTATGADTSASVLGLPPEEDWILHAPYSDKSLLRNFLAFKFSHDLGWYAPRTKLVELYLNEQYQGVYVLTEKIKRDVNRVNVSKLNPNENTGDDLTGGYIVKIDKFDGATAGLGWDSPIYPQNRSNDQVIHFQYHYPKEDEITYEQGNYIQTFVTNFEESLVGTFWKHPELGYRNYINVESFIDFSFINEITKNVDGYRLSTYLYKDKDSKDGKLYAGPVWDFNLGFGNADYCDGGTTQGWAWDFNERCNGDYWLVPFWWKRLLRDPAYKMEFKARWQEVRAGVLSDVNIMNYIDSLVSVLEAPQQRNFEQWPILNQYIWPNNYVGGSYANEVEYLKGWISSRMYWLDTQINAFEIVTGLEEPIAASKQISVYPNPGDGSFSIRFEENPTEAIHISLLNQQGKLIYDQTLDNSELNNGTLSLFSLQNRLPKGIYLLKVIESPTRAYLEKLLVY
jgi:hypothetical protein